MTKQTDGKEAAKTGLSAGSFAALITGAIVANNPELSWAEATLQAGITGVLTGVGVGFVQLWRLVGQR